MERGTRLDDALVQEFVGVAHGDPERVQQLLEKEPALLNAAWDWGAGDWETALGAASHMGRRDIALFLLQRGAHMDIFAAAMLGEVDIVAAMIAAHPALRDTPGPHGIPLVVHAQAGGDHAEQVLQLLGAPTATVGQPS